MAENSKIQWTNHTANLWWGCTKVHEGCDNCYAEALSHRVGNDIWGKNKPRKLVKSVWKDLNRYQRLAAEAGEIHKVFVGSMMDIFEKPMPVLGSDGLTMLDDINTGDLRNELFEFITNGSYPNLMFLLLTKRPSNINKYIPEAWKENPPTNVMFGTSPVNMETMKTLLPQLLKVNGKRFLSIEPQLGEITLRWAPWHDYNNHYRLEKRNGETVGVRNEYDGVDGIDWIIQGGESGHHRRPFDIEWARLLRDQCKEAGIPYFFKQIDKVLPVPEDLLIREFPKQSL
jgi:protein gp37